jgi:hypothetical protein
MDMIASILIFIFFVVPMAALIWIAMGILISIVLEECLGIDVKKAVRKYFKLEE